MPSDAEKTRVKLGALDWRFPAWKTTFYPVDMPDEWQLTYFNTQFNCVFLPREVWRSAVSADHAQWCADTHDQFLFLLEAGAADVAPAALRDKALALAQSDQRILWFDQDTSLKVLAAALSGTQGEVPQFLISRDGNLEQMERVSTLLEVMGLGG
jgi:hypothetical protein